jgi:Flp pilus assembly protein TadD
MTYLGRPDEAEPAHRKAIQLNPKDPLPWTNLGILLMDYLGRPAEAETAFRRAIELNPNLTNAWSGLGGLLAVHLGRPIDAEVAYRKVVEIAPSDAIGWNNLGLLFSDFLGRPSDAETAFRKAIEFDSQFGNPWSGLANLLYRRREFDLEARKCSATGLMLAPDYAFSRHVFIRLCANYAEDWRSVLPRLATWCIANPKNHGVFDFTIDGFLRLARLTQPSEVLGILAGLPDVTPFETLRDACIAHADLSHLNKLAPERQKIAAELLNRMSPPQTTTAELRSVKKKKRS